MPAAGFRKAEREQYEKYVNERQKLDAELNKELTYVSSNIEAIQTGITCQNVFRTFALILQGIKNCYVLFVIYVSGHYLIFFKDWWLVFLLLIVYWLSF